jgi:hypothetical protein
MPAPSKEARVILAIEAIQASKNLSLRAAAKLYDVPETTIWVRMNGRPAAQEYWPVAQNLMEIEEEVVVQYILNLDSRGFPPSIDSMRAMADHILASQNTRRVRKQWPYHFIQQWEELRTHFSRAYGFQRALCEDPVLIDTWFRLVFNMRTKYGIQDGDFYNFDKTGFMIGMICPSMVVIRSDRHGKGKAVQPDNRECVTRASVGE